MILVFLFVVIVTTIASAVFNMSTSGTRPANYAVMAIDINITMTMKDSNDIEYHVAFVDPAADDKIIDEKI